MSRHRVLTCVLATLFACCLCKSVIAEEIWAIQGGSTLVSLDAAALEQLGLEVGSPMAFAIDAGSTLSFSVENGSLTDFLGGQVHHAGNLHFATKQGRSAVGGLQISQVRGEDEARWVVAGPSGELDGLVLHRVKAGFNTAARTLTLHCPSVFLSPRMAEALGDVTLSEKSLGSLTLQAVAEWVGGDEPSGEPVRGGGSRVPGCDMVFCQLYGLYMPSGSRSGDIVGLASGGTSWNRGDQDCIWYAMPNVEHPFIVMDMFRLKTVDGSERFEQIGQSWIKHGFYALGNTQCGGSCTFQPGHGTGNWLGQGCTDTYGPGLNAGQNGLGPRYELNPWTGEWTYPGSHNSQGSHGHSGSEHRLQVHDDDLDPAQNAGATYYTSQFYVMLDDIDAMNSAAWKPVTVSGVPGGQWTFGMSGSGTMPTDGPAINAWTSGQQTLIAPNIPVVEFVSADGRCILSANATDLGGGVWHYEYALMNIDLDRKVDSFSIFVDPSADITNIGFHAVEHHDEGVAGYSNDPWSAEVADGTITWTTIDNPIRWGTLYNFRFDANRVPDPADVQALMESPDGPGGVLPLGGLTVGPCFTDGDMSGDGNTDGGDLQEFVAAIVAASTEIEDLCPGDFDGSGVMDLGDVTGMVTTLVAP